MTGDLQSRLKAKLDERKRTGLFRSLRTANADPGILNLANNDYLDLAKDKRMQSVGIDALSDMAVRLLRLP